MYSCTQHCFEVNQCLRVDTINHSLNTKRMPNRAERVARHLFALVVTLPSGIINVTQRNQSGHKRTQLFQANCLTPGNVSNKSFDTFGVKKKVWDYSVTYFTFPSVGTEYATVHDQCTIRALKWSIRHCRLCVGICAQH